MAELHYVGLAGQLSILAEVAYRGYNVAIPSPDEGDDAITSNPLTGEIQRLQFKTARPKRQKAACQYQFRVPHKQLVDAGVPQRIFVFCMRRGLVFHPLIIRHDDFVEIHEGHAWGTRNGDYWVYTVSFNDDESVTAGAGTKKFHLTHFLRDFSHWANLLPIAAGAAPSTYSDVW